MMLLHKYNDQTDRLIKHLSEDFDIYIHIDKRSSLQIKNNENVFIFKKYKTYWGSFNQIIATLFLLMQAYLKNYSRYLLISGQDLPLKSNKRIIEFFKNNNSEYIRGDKMPVAGLGSNGGFERMTKYWPNYFHHRSNCIAYKYLFKLQHSIFKIISIIKIRPIDYEFYKGTNWINLTHKCVEKIFVYLGQNKSYIKRFKWTNCADEIFYHTIIKQLDNLDIVNESLRYVNWDDGPEYPRIFRKDDYSTIINSNKLFARKFDSMIDNEIVEMIYENIKENN
jgi:hypothetical protein